MKKRRTENPEREEVEAVSRKEKVETLNKKLHELTEEELEKVTGGKNQVVDIISHSEYDLTEPTEPTTEENVPDDSK